MNSLILLISQMSSAKNKEILSNQNAIIEPMNKPDIESDFDEESKNILKTQKFMDKDEDSDNDNEIIIKKQSKLSIQIVPVVLKNRSIIDYFFADTNKYCFKTWPECFPNKKVTLRSLIFNPDWNDFFDTIEKKPYYKGMERILSGYISTNKEIIVPYAELVFNALNVLSPGRIKAVFIGQDPYPGINKVNNKMIPQAMGFSFSVPMNYPKPLSLEKIYINLLEFGHLRKIPNGGCLSSWVLQGCLMINASFTTFLTKRNAHKNVWRDFTDDLLQYISKTCTNIVFVVWGKDAHMLCQKINPKQHCIITSSHPSPLAFDKTFGGFSYGEVKNSSDRKSLVYPSFRSVNHFGKINDYLKSIKKQEIMWDLIDNNLIDNNLIDNKS